GFACATGVVDLENVSRRAAPADSAGLGLLVACRVAEAHGGEVIATNGVDGWTLVELVVPRRRDAA
ncbi:MAG: sensor histidine kinase, partial [Planctomycetes bacterium]|nr:sensor histidine kinase [Planctomycetota bacterium]